MVSFIMQNNSINISNYQNIGNVYIYQHRSTTSLVYLLYMRMHDARAAAEKLGYHRPSLPCITSQTRKYFVCTSVLNKVFFLFLEEGNTLRKSVFMI